MKKYNVGYTQGTFDLFHTGHLNIINNAKKMCDFLIVGVNSDSLVKSYKNKIPIINENERAKILNSIKGVDKVIIVQTLDKVLIHQQINFNAIFIGDDWKENKRWKQTVNDLSRLGVDTIFLPHTDGISTTKIIENIKKR